MPPGKLHLTLVFLGSTVPERVPEVAQALTRVAGAHEAFEMETGEGGGRASQRRGGVAWVRLSSGESAVSNLALALDAAIGSATYDERRAPRPHLTVARGVSEETIAALRRWAAGRPPLRWRVERLALFRSHTGQAGSRYEELTTAALLTGADRAT